MADDVACNARNREPGTIFNHYDRKVNLCAAPIQIDYRGDEVTVETFLRILTDRWDDATRTAPGFRQKRLLSDANSNVLIYLNGHGGDEFLKFQDMHEFTAVDLANSLMEMHLKNRYRQCLFILDTCQAASMLTYVKAPNVIGLSSSLKGESSYSHHVDSHLGVPVVDRFTSWTMDWMERHQHEPEYLTFANFENSWRDANLLSTASLMTTVPHFDPKKASLLDFFMPGSKFVFTDAPSMKTLLSVQNVDMPKETAPLKEDKELPHLEIQEDHYPIYKINFSSGEEDIQLTDSYFYFLSIVVIVIGYFISLHRMKKGKSDK